MKILLGLKLTVAGYQIQAKSAWKSRDLSGKISFGQFLTLVSCPLPTNQKNLGLLSPLFDKLKQALSTLTLL